MNVMMETTDLTGPEEIILQEKDCAVVDDASLSAAQVLSEQIEYADGEDSRAPLFVP
jgi:hypothetical protein